MWNDVGMNSGGADFLKPVAGQLMKVHVLGEAEGAPAEPKSFFQYFNQDVQRGVVVPRGHKDATIKVRAQHAILVWSFADETVKVWAVGNRVAAALKGIMETYDGSFSTVDLTIKRSGAGLDTVYQVTPKPTEFDASVLEGVEIPDLETLFAENTEEEIENLKNGIVPTREESAGDENASTGEAPAGETDDERELREFKEAQAAKKAKMAGVKPAPTKPAPGKPSADPRITLVKAITAKFMANAKYKTPVARTTLIKSVAKGKTALTQLSVPELQKLSGLIK